MPNAITESIARYAVTLPSSALSPAVLDRTKQLLLDFLGVALGGRALGPGAAEMERGVRRLAGEVPGPCTVAGDAGGYPAHYAALLNAAFAHTMDFDDTHRDAVMHQGTPLFAALLALAETQGASGRDVLAAAAAGYEIGAKLGRAHLDRVHQRGFHPTATTGIFAVTAAAGRLLGLDEAAIRSALGLSLSMAAGTAQFAEGGGSNKPFQVGMAAHDAIYAVTMAQEGLAGTAGPLEGAYGYFNSYADPGSDLSRIALDPASPTEVLSVAVKPYPACRYAHAAIDGVTTLMAREKLGADDIESIDLTISAPAYQLVGAGPEQKRRPRSIVDAQFSIYFAAAAAASQPAYTWDSYADLSTPVLNRLMDATTARVSDAARGLETRVSITAKSGRCAVIDVPLPKGEPETPLTWPELEQKVLNLAARTIPEARARQIVQAVKTFEALNDITELTRLLRP